MQVISGLYDNGKFLIDNIKLSDKVKKAKLYIVVVSEIDEQYIEAKPVDDNEHLLAALYNDAIEESEEEDKIWSKYL